MKKLVAVIFLLSSLSLVAQDHRDENDRKGTFQKERLFSGGSVNVGFSNRQTVLGISPQLGYSVTDWLDAGVAVNFTYSSVREFNNVGKLRQTVYGPGAFVRIFPVNFLFASAQYEYNFLKVKYIPSPGSSSTADTYNTNAPSFLVGGGYAGGRQKGNNTYYFFSVSWDIMQDPNSPYIDGFGRSNPVIRAGYNIGLFQGKSQRRY